MPAESIGNGPGEKKKTHHKLRPPQQRRFAGKHSHPTMVHQKKKKRGGRCGLRANQTKNCRYLSWEQEKGGRRGGVRDGVFRRKTKLLQVTAKWVFATQVCEPGTPTKNKKYDECQNALDSEPQKVTRRVPGVGLNSVSVRTIKYPGIGRRAKGGAMS